jgi:hypothetical protein
MFTSSVNAREVTWPKGPFGLLGNRYGLAITVLIDEWHPLEKEIRVVNEHYINWLKRHGKNCCDLILVFESPASSTEAILAQCRRLLKQDVGDDKTLAAMDIEVGIVDSETKTETQYKLKWDPNASASAAEPPADVLRETNILAVSGLAPGQETLLFIEGDPVPVGIEEARRRIPEFKVFLDSPQAGVTVLVPWVCGDIREFIEAVLVGRAGDELEVEFTPRYATGPVRKKYRFEDILDWTVHHQNGQKSGGFTTRDSARDSQHTGPPGA